MKRVTQEEALNLVYKYGKAGTAPDDAVVALAKSYVQLIELCRRASDHAETATEALRKSVRALADEGK